MKAIVLSCDKYHQVTDHMIRAYQTLWPDHPFTFRVPYQNYPQDLVNQHKENIELINSPPNIKQTLLTLISDLSDQEWVYWCIDDKYPIFLDVEIVSNLYKYIKSIENLESQGLMFCRCRKLLFKHNLRTNSKIQIQPDISLVERKNYYQFWIHQFLRVSVLRELFQQFPDREFSAKEMDYFTGQVDNQTVMPFKKNQKMYVTLKNHAQFGESTHRGKLTANCYQSMISQRMIPNRDWKTSNVSLIMGRLHQTKKEKLFSFFTNQNKVSLN